MKKKAASWETFFRLKEPTRTPQRDERHRLVSAKGVERLQGGGPPPSLPVCGVRYFLGVRSKGEYTQFPLSEARYRLMRPGPDSRLPG